MSSPQHGTFRAPAAVELAVVERSGFVESRHIGSAVVLGPDGVALRVLGDATAPIFPRSALKPFQALSAVSAGAELTDAELVIATASHAGTAEQALLVRGILAKAKLPLGALQTPADWPLDRSARDDLVRSGHRAHPIFMNCSGKHAAWLLACVASGWDTDSYLDPEHPLQERVREVIQRLTGERITSSGVDGCGAPVHAISLTGLAAGFSRIRLATTGSPWPLYRDAAALTDAILAHGWLLDGPGRPNAVVVQRLGVLAKTGAEGVLAMSAPDGTTVAVKVLDGSSRAVTAVALKLLVSVGALPRDAVDAVLPELDLAITGGNVPVGAIRVTAA